MSTDRTPQNKVNGNEEVNVDKTVRATNFDFPQNTPSKGEEPDKPLDGTIRIDMPKMEAPKPAAPKPLDGTVRAPGLNQPITPRPAAPRPAAPRPAAPRPAAPKALDGTVRAPGLNQPITPQSAAPRPAAPKALDGTVRAPGINQPIAPQPVTPQPAAPKPAAPSMGSTVRGAQPQPQAQAQAQVRPNVNISIISSASNTDRAKKQRLQRNLIDENIYTLKGQEYRRVSVLSENTGEAEVFLVEKDNKEYVLKVYYPNFDVNRKILQTVLNFDFEMVVKVYDFGKTYVDGKHRYYELMEYLQGGSMAEFNLEGDINKFRRIALQSAAALAYCHQLRILHKDIKPGNFFFRDKDHNQLVLGDFGISSMLEEDGKSHKTTQARTPIYAAPEMYADVIDGVVEISPKADYYSLGISLMTLWLGESPMSTNERVMMRQKNEGRIPRMNELPERIKLLVMGLTVVNPINRWGYEQVEQWFLGESPKVDLS